MPLLYCQDADVGVGLDHDQQVVRDSGLGRGERVDRPERLDGEHQKVQR